ncbi:MAG: hypothetical protein AAF490_08705 [Chloroflexota bacterium]
MQITTEIAFKFKFVKNGSAQGFRSKKASASTQRLFLNELNVPYDAIMDTTSRDNRLVIQLFPNSGVDEEIRKEFAQSNVLILEVSQAKAIDLEKYIDRHASLQVANKRKKMLAAKGQEHLFKSITCPHCSATVDLTDYEKSPHIYCRYCESILSQSLELIADGDHYRHCDECNLFDRVQGHTEFYFYFLLIVYGFRSKRRHLCDACALKISNKALLINFPFILGIFPALYMRIKASQGKDGKIKNITKANKLALAGKYQEADTIYENMLMNHPDHPGILFNQAMAHFNGQDAQAGVDYVRRSMNASGNYLPSLRLISRLNQAAQAKRP